MIDEARPSVAVAKLRAIDKSDREQAHSMADGILLDLLDQLAPEVADEYRLLQARCLWWARS